MTLEEVTKIIESEYHAFGRSPVLVRNAQIISITSGGDTTMVPEEGNHLFVGHFINVQPNAIVINYRFNGTEYNGVPVASSNEVFVFAAAVILGGGSGQVGKASFVGYRLVY